MDQRDLGKVIGKDLGKRDAKLITAGFQAECSGLRAFDVQSTGVFDTVHQHNFRQDPLSLAAASQRRVDAST